ncbi:MAG: hypothetical protein NC189_08895 [Bacteroides sp.]|nr:hypothetical protein [Bacteroides sp.]
MKKVLLVLITVIFAGASTVSASAENVVFKVESSSHQILCKDFESEVTRNADGSWTIADYFNSGSPLSFTLSEQPVGGKYAINITSEGFYSGVSVFPYDKDGNFMSYTMKFDDGSEEEISSPYIYMDGYSFALVNTGATPTTNCVICNYCNRKDASQSGFIFVSFTLNGDLTAAIENIDADSANLPVEYFSIDGKRVVNPDKGFYIRKQGGKSEKVLIR